MDYFKRAAANVKVIAKDAVKNGSSLMSKVMETDVKETASRLTNKMMEKVEGSNFKLIEMLPEVESAMLSIKQTDALYRDLLISLKESFVSETRASIRQLKAANKAEIVGRDLEDGRSGDGSDVVGRSLCEYAGHILLTAENSQQLTNIRDAADVEERAQDDFETRVYDTPASRLIEALELFLDREMAGAVRARADYKDLRREVSLNARRADELAARLVGSGGADPRLEALRGTVAEGIRQLEARREELLRAFMAAEQRKPTLQTSLHAFLSAQLDFHRRCLQSADQALARLEDTQTLPPRPAGPPPTSTQEAAVASPMVLADNSP